MNHHSQDGLRAFVRGSLIAAVTMLLFGCPWLCGPDSVTIDFGTLTNGTMYSVGDSITIGDATVKVLPFQWTGGTVTNGGTLMVDDMLKAGGSGLDVNLNNVCLGFSFGRTVDSVSLKFGEYGGNINAQTNDDFVNQDNFFGMVLPGIALTINDFGSSKGSIVATGSMPPSSFALEPGAGEFNFVIGGQELWIDDIVVEW